MERDKKIAVENLGEGESRKSACVVLAREAVRIKGLRKSSLSSNTLRNKPLRLSMFDFFGVNQERWLLYASVDTVRVVTDAKGRQLSPQYSRHSLALFKDARKE